MDVPVPIDRFLLIFGERLLDLGFDLFIEDSTEALKRGMQVRIEVQSGIDWFDLHAVVDGERIGASRIDASDPLLAAGFLRLEKRFIHIGREEEARLARLASAMDPEVRNSRIDARNLEAIAAVGELQLDATPPYFQRRLEISRLLRRTEGLPKTPVPAAVAEVLRPYQETGYQWLRFLARNGFNGCLADDMGLGKTLQALAFLLGLREEGETLPSLVVAPVSTLFNWQAEARRFTPDLIHSGPPRSQAAEGCPMDLLPCHYPGQLCHPA